MSSKLVLALVAVGVSACGAGGVTPSAVVGSWYAGSGGVSAPYNPSTGTWGHPNGSGLVYVFNADGTYTKAFQSYASNGGCTSGYTAFETGTVSAPSGQLVTTPASGQLKYEDTCAPSLDSDTPTSAGELVVERFSYVVSGADLLLTRDDGASSHFARIE